MKKSFEKQVIIVGLLLAIGGALSVQAEEPSIQTLATHYAQLRARKQALPAGVFDKDLSGAGGQLESVLAELGNRLGKPPYRPVDIIRFMGKPDAVQVAGEAWPASLGRSVAMGVVPKNSVLLVYFWRGWHDYLYFVSQNGMIQAAHWSYAGE